MHAQRPRNLQERSAKKGEDFGVSTAVLFHGIVFITEEPRNQDEAPLSTRSDFGNEASQVRSVLTTFYPVLELLLLLEDGVCPMSYFLLLLFSIVCACFFFFFCASVSYSGPTLGVVFSCNKEKKTRLCDSTVVNVYSSRLHMPAGA